MEDDMDALPREETLSIAMPLKSRAEPDGPALVFES
jgi:hypothetical protein